VPERWCGLRQIDFTEARLSLKLDPSAELLKSFVRLNNQVLERFRAGERSRIGVHTCPGGDRDSTHSADIDYSALRPLLFGLNAGRFYIQLAGEPDRKKVLATIAGLLKTGQIVFIGTTHPINPVVETPEQVRDRVIEAASFIPVAALGRPMIADSLPLRTTLRLRATSPLPRYRAASKELP